MPPRAQAAQRLWRDLTAGCTTAAKGDLDTDDVGYIVLELGLALLALDFGKPELCAYVDVIRADLENDRLAAVNTAFRAQGRSPVTGCPSWSWVSALSGLQRTHPRWAEQQLSELAALLAFTPTRKLGLHSL